MADLESAAPDLDSMDAKGIGELKERMTRGEDVSVPAKPAPAPAAKPAEAAAGADGDVDAGADGGSTVETQPAGQPERQRSETVPFGQFDKERNRRKEAETRAEQRDRENSELRDRVAALEKRPAVPEAQPVTPPDPNTSPIEAIVHFGKEFEAFKAETLQQRKDREDREAQATATTNALTYAQQEFGAAAKTDATVEPAYNSLLQSFALEMQTFGVPDAEIPAKLKEIEQQHIFYALNQKIPLAEYVKRLATARGWKATPAVAAPGPAEVAAQAQPDAAATLEATRRAATSLAGTGGAPARTGTPTPQTLLDMSPAQYAKFRESHTINEAFTH